VHTNFRIKLSFTSSNAAVPPWLTRITDRICQWTGLFPSAINHVLINEYHPNQGIMVSNRKISIVCFLYLHLKHHPSLTNNNFCALQPHQDGPAYYPVVAIISLASPVVIDFTPHQRLKEQQDTDPQDLQAHELLAPAETESNGTGSHERGATNESDPSSSSLMLMPCSLLVFKDQAYTG
jgi:alkylated DNA repair protein alkB family protein 6